MIRNWIISKFT